MDAGAPPHTHDPYLTFADVMRVEGTSKASACRQTVCAALTLRTPPWLQTRNCYSRDRTEKTSHRPFASPSRGDRRAETAARRRGGGHPERKTSCCHLLDVFSRTLVRQFDKGGCDPAQRRQQQRHEPGLHHQPVGAACFGSVGPGLGAHPPALRRDVVLGVPLVSVLLSAGTWCDGAAHAGHSAETQEGPAHHPAAGQCGLPGLPHRRGHHQCGSGRCVPRRWEGHGASGGLGVWGGADGPRHPHLLLPCPRHALSGRLPPAVERGGTRRCSRTNGSPGIEP